MARIIRRGLQLSRGAPQSGLTARRQLSPEILDDLPAADPRAIRSRRDLQRVNRVMGSCGIMSRAIRHALPSSSHNAPLRILELGAGDGTLALRIARRLATSWPIAEVTLLDRQPLATQATGTAFADLGWTLRPLTVDVLEWARTPVQEQPAARWDVIMANLFLHHLEEAGLRELLSAIATRCNVLVACEPRRSLPALTGSKLMYALGVSADTRHDAIVSVRAGFRGKELSQMWPTSRAHWRLEEHLAGAFSHLFVAARGV